MARFIDELKRTHRCGDLRAADAGKEVILFGWVATLRDHGGCVFIDLRDREGITQIVFDPAYLPKTDAQVDAPTVKAAHKLAEDARTEWVVGIRGIVVSRGTRFIRPVFLTAVLAISAKLIYDVFAKPH